MPSDTPATTDPLDMELPCDIQMPGVRFGKGVKLRTFVEAARRWKRMADELTDIQYPVLSSEKALDVFPGNRSATRDK